MLWLAIILYKGHSLVTLPLPVCACLELHTQKGSTEVVGVAATTCNVLFSKNNLQKLEKNLNLSINKTAFHLVQSVTPIIY